MAPQPTPPPPQPSIFSPTAHAVIILGMSSLEKTLPVEREKVMRCGVRWPMKSVCIMNVMAANCDVNCLRKVHRSVYDGMHAAMY